MQPYGLKGSAAGCFLMGSGQLRLPCVVVMTRFIIPLNTGGLLRWSNDSLLQPTLDAVVAGIADCQADNGYIMAFPQNQTDCRENPDYVTAWLTHGLLAAHASGNTQALTLLRQHFDWFNGNPQLPLFLPPLGGPEVEDGPFPDKKQPQFDHGHLIYIIYQVDNAIDVSIVIKDMDVCVLAGNHPQHSLSSLLSGPATRRGCGRTTLQGQSHDAKRHIAINLTPVNLGRLVVEPANSTQLNGYLEADILSAQLPHHGR
jgi:hypothetical protein